MRRPLNQLAHPGQHGQPRRALDEGVEVSSPLCAALVQEGDGLAARVRGTRSRRRAGGGRGGPRAPARAWPACRHVAQVELLAEVGRVGRAAVVEAHEVERLGASCPGTGRRGTWTVSSGTVSLTTNSVCCRSRSSRLCATFPLQLRHVHGVVRDALEVGDRVGQHGVDDCVQVGGRPSIARRRPFQKKSNDVQLTLNWVVKANVLVDLAQPCCRISAGTYLLCCRCSCVRRRCGASVCRPLPPSIEEAVHPTPTWVSREGGPGSTALSRPGTSDGSAMNGRSGCGAMNVSSRLPPDSLRQAVGAAADGRLRRAGPSRRRVHLHGFPGLIGGLWGRSPGSSGSTSRGVPSGQSICGRRAPANPGAKTHGGPHRARTELRGLDVEWVRRWEGGSWRFAKELKRWKGLAGEEGPRPSPSNGW